MRNINNHKNAFLAKKTLTFKFLWFRLALNKKNIYSSAI